MFNSKLRFPFSSCSFLDRFRFFFWNLTFLVESAFSFFVSFRSRFCGGEEKEGEEEMKTEEVRGDEGRLFKRDQEWPPSPVFLKR